MFEGFQPWSQVRQLGSEPRCLSPSLSSLIPKTGNPKTYLLLWGDKLLSRNTGVSNTWLFWLAGQSIYWMYSCNYLLPAKYMQSLFVQGSFVQEIKYKGIDPFGGGGLFFAREMKIFYFGLHTQVHVYSFNMWFWEYKFNRGEKLKLFIHLIILSEPLPRRCSGCEQEK